MTATTAGPVPSSRGECEAWDAANPLLGLRELFELPNGVVYLDGNSLGALPRAGAERMVEVVRRQWGQGLVQSWNDADWAGLPRRVGDKVARLVGADPGQVLVADSTSVNLYKVLWAALRLQGLRPGQTLRRVVLVDAGTFPTDGYIAASVADSFGLTLKPVDPQRIPDLLRHRADRDVAVVMMNHVDYRTGRLHDMAALTAAAHAAGALAVWDLAHSAGALPVDLIGCDVDLAVGCGYKYLNGGPGAPAFLWVHPRHHDRAEQPLTGWFGHAAPFDFSDDYRPAPGVARFGCGTPPVLGLAALECGVDTVLAAEDHGGLLALRASSLALTRTFRALVAERCPELTCLTPAADAEHGSQVTFTHPGDGYAIVQALIARGVVGDFRRPNLLRFAVTPLYTRHVDVWDAAMTLERVLASGMWRDPQYAVRAAVT